MMYRLFEILQIRELRCSQISNSVNAMQLTISLIHFYTGIEMGK